VHHLHTLHSGTTAPMITTSTREGSIVALLITSFRTRLVNFYNGILCNEPPYLPIGVRAPLTMTTFFNCRLLKFTMIILFSAFSGFQPEFSLNSIIKINDIRQSSYLLLNNL
jgi:hypothetical protein